LIGQLIHGEEEQKGERIDFRPPYQEVDHSREKEEKQEKEPHPWIETCYKRKKDEVISSQVGRCKVRKGDASSHDG